MATKRGSRSHVPRRINSRRERARELAGRGVARKDIAERLRCSIHTVNSYCQGMGRSGQEEKLEWVGPLPELDESEKPHIDDFAAAGQSCMSHIAEHAPDLSGLDANDLNPKLRRAMAARGMAVYSRDDWMRGKPDAASPGPWK